MTEEKFDRCRRVTFTDFDTAKPVFNDSMDYLIVGSETCPTTGKHHWQCYAEFKAPVRFTAFKKLFPKSHVEASKGTGQQNRDYCSKGGTFEEFGTMKRQGERNDLNEPCAKILEGTLVSDVALEYPVQYVKYHKGFDRLAGAVLKKKQPKWRDVEVIALIGPSGCGKTRLAMSEEVRPHIKNAKVTWFDGYEGEKTLVLDEMKFGSTPPYEDLLTILDGHPHQVPVKGAMVPMMWTKVFICSVQDVDQWYQRQDLSELKRRITKVVHFDKSGTEVPGVILTPALAPRRPNSRRVVTEEEA